MKTNRLRYGLILLLVTATHVAAQFTIHFNSTQTTPSQPIGLLDEQNWDKKLGAFFPWLIQDSDQPIHALIQILREPTPDERRILGSIGIQLQKPIDRHTYMVLINTQAAREAQVGTLMAGKTYFYTLAPYEARFKFSRKLRDTALNGQQQLLVHFHSEITADRVRKVLKDRAQGEKPWGLSNDWKVQTTLIDAGKLAERDEVYFIAPFPAPPSPLSPPPPPAGKPAEPKGNPPHTPSSGALIYPKNNYGSNVLIAVYEFSAPNTNHYSFLAVDGNQLNTNKTRIATNMQDVKAHATGVASLAASNGQDGQGVLDPEYRGAAPEATIDCREATLYDYETMVVATNKQSHVSNHSYAQSETTYNGLCRRVDQNIRGIESDDPTTISPLMIPQTWAAGNTGGGAELNSDPQGYYSIVSPAKNSISIGLLDRKTGLLSMASSLGPTLDGRIKPDLVAPGVINSYADPPIGRKVASKWNVEDYEAALPPGTSFASPLASGTIALILYQYKANCPQPYPTLLPSSLKAVLVHTAIDCIDPAGPPYDNPDFQYPMTTKLFQGPDWASGYGLIDPAAACALITESNQWRQRTFEQTGQERQFAISCTNAVNVRVTLGWDDLPGCVNTGDFSRKLMNDLDLWVCPRGGCETDEQKKFPWTLQVPAPDPADPDDNITVQADQIVPAQRDRPDTLNNIEVVDFTADAGTEWVIHVRATQLRSGLEQAFSLFCSQEIQD